ncbi:DUF805 domain-containing protein [Ramlibacter albus]|uniref:DUF805 domain-containing protein n=1 Tax=Ramlibacter albus TaxID=2079448 RepID=A0A923S0M9_9BURK|nr:DUF805 domain-containing protein [Ramlibacter albus]MBC5763534.1 DUF805 domain-containing protein [Ramlibacter albus]
MRKLLPVFGFRGRLSRAAFWLRVVLIGIAFVVLDAAMEPLLGAARVWVLNPLVLWALLAALARRLHDRDYSAWWLLFGLVPVLGAFWLLWQSLRRGSASDNRYGADPRRDTADFLVVGG